MFTTILKRVLIAAIMIAATSVHAMDKGYKLGSVWNVSLISVESGQTDDYIKSLKGFYTTVMDEAIKDKLVVSYKMLDGTRSNPSDWNFLILIEYKNWAAFDGLNDRFDALRARMAGSEAKADESDKKAMTERVKIRSIFGSKTMQEILLTK
jgi:hypothetical protein